MTNFATSIVIQASPQRIWALLQDVQRWPEWNSTIDRVEGKAALGATLKVFTKRMPGRAFPLKVSELVAETQMVWSGGMPLGLFRGTRTYTLSPASSGGTEFAMREEFTGLMAPLITKSIPDLQPDFEQFARDLKMAAENGAAS